MKILYKMLPVCHKFEFHPSFRLLCRPAAFLLYCMQKEDNPDNPHGYNKYSYNHLFGFTAGSALIPNIGFSPRAMQSLGRFAALALRRSQVSI
jgi:hypothetical protein